MEKVEIDRPHSEASALLAIRNDRLLESRGWEEGFWIVSDEKKIEKGIAALGRKKGEKGDDAWEVVPLDCDRSYISRGRITEDCEALARAGSWIYMFGSHYRSEEGPIAPDRHFAARFNEAMVTFATKFWKVELDVVGEPFYLHQILNDGLRESGLDLADGDEKETRAFRKEAKELAEGPGKPWKIRLDQSDRLVNVEGATFLPNANLLLGLRDPVTFDGHPILIEIEGIDRMFIRRMDPPVVRGVYAVTNIGSTAAPHGVRALDAVGEDLHLVTGRPEGVDGKKIKSTHWRVKLPLKPNSKLRAKKLKEFTAGAVIEGLTGRLEGPTWYVHESDTVKLERVES